MGNAKTRLARSKVQPDVHPPPGVVPLAAWDAGDHGTSRLSLTLSCRRIKKTKGARIIVLYMLDNPNDETSWRPVLATDISDESVSPEFPSSLEVDYQFQHNETIRFALFHVPSRGRGMSQSHLELLRGQDLALNSGLPPPQGSGGDTIGSSLSSLMQSIPTFSSDTVDPRIIEAIMLADFEANDDPDADRSRDTSTQAPYASERGEIVSDGEARDGRGHVGSSGTEGAAAEGLGCDVDRPPFQRGGRRVSGLGGGVGGGLSSAMVMGQKLLRLSLPGAAGTDDPDLLGWVDLNIHELAGALGTLQAHRLKRSARAKHIGYLVVGAEQMKHIPYSVSLAFRVAEAVPKKNSMKGISRSKKGRGARRKFFLVVSRSSESGDDEPVYRTEVATADACWRDIRVSYGRLCDGDMERLFHIDAFLWKPYGPSILMGRWTGSVAFLNEVPGRVVPFRWNRQGNKRGDRRSGLAPLFVTIEQCGIEHRHSFLEYIQSGCDIGLMVAIDFTASNGDTRSEQSLHYMYGPEPNAYETAIRAVCDILAHYDSDQLYPTFGFGAKFPDGSVQHCFALNGNPLQPNCEGVAGIMDAYRKALHHVSLHGPTNFAPLLRQARGVAARPISQKHQHYNILLIITDGIISDIEATREELVLLQDLPLSIIIVGVGDADFSDMFSLDNDLDVGTGDGTLRKDVVKFVPFNAFKGLHSKMLSKHVLEEVPEQLLNYFEEHDFVPNTPRRPSSSPSLETPASAAKTAATHNTNGHTVPPSILPPTSRSYPKPLVLPPSPALSFTNSPALSPIPAAPASAQDADKQAFPSLSDGSQDGEATNDQAHVKDRDQNVTTNSTSCKPATKR